ncbi:MAG: DinB family protein [Candidatus Dormibacteria bacterium]
MSPKDPKAGLQDDLQEGRQALVWKLEGLSEYDARRPLVPTGTNLLGLIKHCATCEAGYFGDTFGRPFPQKLPWWSDDAEPNADLWATADESREEIVGLYRRVWAHSDATIRDLGLEAVGHVPWWGPPGNEVTLLRILVYMIAETHRHAGHADVVRELIDGSTGWRADDRGLPEFDESWWRTYRERLESAAQRAEAAARDASP